jgi:hypothetical protein
MKTYEIVRRNGDRHTVLLDDDFTIDRSIFYVGGSAKIRLNGKDVFLHRYIMGITDPSIKVDHIDRNPLNNQKHNLRIATTTENAQNKIAKGVSFNKRDKLWVATIHINGKRTYISSHKNEQDAIQAYRKRHAQEFGEFSPWRENGNDN